MIDDRTIALYDARAQDYADQLSDLKPGKSLSDFIADIPPQGHVLDLGCGTGRSAAAMAAAGLQVDALDASQGMIALAREKYGITARLGTFDDIAGNGIYDGIWANFSLTHAPRSAIPNHLDAIAQALKPKGQLHIGMKTGTGTHRDRLGRLYTLVTQAELTTWLTASGLTPTSVRSGAEKGFAGDIDPFIVIRAQKHA